MKEDLLILQEIWTQNWMLKLPDYKSKNKGYNPSQTRWQEYCDYNDDYQLYSKQVPCDIITRETHIRFSDCREKTWVFIFNNLATHCSWFFPHLYSVLFVSAFVDAVQSLWLGRIWIALGGNDILRLSDSEPDFSGFKNFEIVEMPDVAKTVDVISETRNVSIVFWYYISTYQIWIESMQSFKSYWADTKFW